MTPVERPAADARDRATPPPPPADNPARLSYEDLALLAEVRQVPLDGRDVDDVVVHLASCLYPVADCDVVGMVVDYAAGPHVYLCTSSESPVGAALREKMLATYCTDVPTAQVPVTYLGFQRAALSDDRRMAPRSEALFTFESGRQRLGIIGLFGLKAGMFGPEVETRMAQLHEEFVRVLRFLRYRQATEAQAAALRETLEQQVADRTKQLVHQERLASLGTLSASIAHEINNPTSFIRGNAQTMQEAWAFIETALDGETVDPARLKMMCEEMPKMLAAMVHGTDRITTIVNGLKRFAHQDHGKRSWVTLGDAVAHARTLAGTLIKHGITVHEVWPDRPLARVFANAQELEQVIINLIVNAVHAMEPCEERTLTITGHQLDPDYVTLSVADTGVGIPADKLSRIFEPFYTTKEAKRGTGLGLSISENIITSFDGEISVDSTPRKGTTFTIRLPCETTPDEPTAPDEPVDSSLRARTDDAGVLIIDHEADAVEVAERALKDAGYAVTTADTGEAGLSRCAKLGDALHVVVIDLILPDGDGLDFARRIRKGFPTVPIVLMSAYFSGDQMAHLLEEQWFGVLQKPFTTTACLRAVRDMLDKCPGGSAA